MRNVSEVRAFSNNRFFYEFWRETLEQLAEDSAFYIGNSLRARSDTYQTINVNIPRKELHTLEKMAGDKPEIYFSAVTASLALLLHRYTGVPTIIIDTPLYKKNLDARRCNERVPAVIGIDTSKTLSDFLKATNDRLKFSYMHQNFPVEFSDAEPVKTNVLVSFDEMHCEISDAGRYDLVINVKRDPDFLTLTTRFNGALSNLFNGFLDAHLTNILQAWSTPQLKVSAMEIVSENERHLIHQRIDKTCDGAWKTANILDAFEKFGRSTPNQIALLCGEKCVTYGALYRQSVSMAHSLNTHFDVSAGDVVGVFLERSEMSIVALFAILNAGAVYLPLDIDTPEERLRFMVDNSGMKIVITDSSSLEKVLPLGLKYYVVDIVIPKEHPEIVQSRPGGDAPAYIIYTSGSTGLPKGVVVSHAAAQNMVDNQIGLFGVRGDDRVLQFSSTSFDASISEIFMAASSGATLVIVPRKVIMNADEFVKYLADHRVTVATLPPSYLNAVTPERISGLRIIITAGEPAIKSDADKCRQFARYFNAYGPTECAVCSSVFQYEGVYETLPIGKPIGNVDMHILNDDLNVCPIGIEGEIYIGGAGLALGYLNNESLTNQSFIADPFNEGRRLYKSGDRGRWLPDGNIEFLGRRDGQVKINGQRVELGDIESQLMAFPKIGNAAVVLSGAAGDKMTAYVIPTTDFTTEEVRSFLSRRISSYMIPGDFICVEEFPYTISGKIDRKALLALQTTEAADTLTPEDITPSEQKILDIWKSVLGQKDMSVHDNYFALGGDSLKAIRIVVKMNETLQCGLEIEDLYNHSTIRALDNFLKNTHPSSNITNDYLFEGMKILDDVKSKVLAQHDLVSDFRDRIEDVYPITDIESGMIYSSLLRPDEPVYYDQFTYEVRIKDYNKVIEAIDVLIQRHSNLRALYFIGKFQMPVKIVLKTIDPPVCLEDLSNLPLTDQRKKILYYKTKDLADKTGFNGELLWKMRLFKTGPDHYFIVWSCHHALLDGWSQNLFITDLSKLFNEGNTLRAMDPLRHSYRDYCAISVARQTTPSVFEFWRQYLKDYSRTKLPFNYSGKRKRSVDGMERTGRSVDAGIVNGMEKLSVQHGISMKAICLSAHLYLMHVTCSEADIVTGVVTHERPAIEDADKILGCFLNTIPVRVDFSAVSDAITLLRTVQQYLNEVREYEIHLTGIAKAVGEKTSQGNPLFDHMMNFTEFHILSEWNDNQIIAPDNSVFENYRELAGTGMTNTLYDLEVNKTPRGLTTTVKYAAAYFDKKDIEYGLVMYERILQYIVNSPEMPLSQCELLSLSDKKLLLHDFNDTIEPYSSETLLHQLFEQQVALTPSNIALIHNGVSVSYDMLNASANRVANHLISAGLIPNEPVGLRCTRSFDMLIGLFAILKAGGSYVPVETTYPQERQEYILTNSHVHRVVGNVDLPEAFHGRFSFIDLRQQYHNYSDENPVPRCASRDLAYTIYTSGSTGQPKGVMIEHHSAVNLIEWVNSTFQIGPADRLLFITSICFDLSVYDIFGILASGGAVVIGDHDDVQSVSALWRLIREQRITFWDSVPTTLDFLVNELEHLDTTEAESGMRLIFLSGDWIPSSLPDRAKAIFPKAQVISLGGATEGTVWSNYYKIEQPSSEWNSIPYGRPIRNNFFYILNEQGVPVPRGVAGELYIGGVGVARGYANDETKSAQSFKDDPFRSELGGRMYATGDLGRLTADLNMEFLGRKDHQVKIRGYRIELGEIESILIKHPFIKAAVVEAREDDRKQKYLCGYVVLDHGSKIESEAIKDYLARHLPSYMIPPVFMLLEKLPLTSNGKLSRKELPAPQLAPSAERSHQPPVTQLEKQISDIWQSILKLEVLSVEDDLLDLGAHSLHIGAFINRLERQIGKVISVRDVFSSPSIRGLASVVSNQINVAESFIEPIEHQERYEISHAQKRLWVLDQFANVKGAYTMPGAYVLKGDVNIEALQSAFARLIHRHESLRTAFIEEQGNVWQKVRDVEDIEFGIKCYHTSDEQEIRHIIEQESKIPFDLSVAPLLRTALITKSANEHILFFNIHHIITDGWSMGTIIREIIQLYNSISMGAPDPLRALKIHYKDYSNWQNNELKGDRLEHHRQFWLKKYSGEIPVLQLPLDFSRPAEKTYNGKGNSLVFDPELTSRLKEYANARGATLFMTLLASVEILLFKYTGQEEIIIGTPVSGRDHADLHDQIGFYVNALALQSKVIAQDTFDQVLDRVKDEMLTISEHQVYPFDRLVDELNVRKDMSRSPLFDVMVSLQHRSFIDISSDAMEGITVEPYETPFVVSRYDMVFNFKEVTRGILLHLEYNTDLFADAKVDRMLKNYIRLVENLVAGPSRQVCQIPTITEEEELLINSMSSNRGDLPVAPTLHSLFEAQVKLDPHHVAVYDNEVSVSYEKLNADANRLARFLQTKCGIERGMMVGVTGEKGYNLMVSLLAILKAGAGYLPIDSEYPEARIRYIIDDSKIGALIITDNSRIAGGVTTIHIADVLPQLTGFDDHDLAGGTAQDLAYVIYTSGSTGLPKGVMIEHLGAVNRIQWMWEEYRFGRHDIILQKTPAVFDVSVWELFMPLCFGASLVMCPKEIIYDPENLRRWIKRYGVTTIHFVPSVYNVFLNSLQHKEVDDLSTLRRVFCSGEALSTAVVDQHYRLLSIPLFNLYGPTEASVDVTHCETHPNERSIPIGKPIRNMEIHILDRNLCAVPIGVPGEIYISGIGLARGYLNQPQRTAERFLKVGSRIMYKTGDLGKWREDGNIEFLGRMDDQIKIRGYRIELGEIENVLRQSPEVHEAVVIPRQAGTEMELVAYYVPVKPPPYKIGKIRADNHSGLPERVRLFELPNGLKMYGYNEAELLFLYDEIFRNESYLRNGISINPGDCIVDVGANMGMFSVYASLMADNLDIYCFEPLPPTFGVLELNTQLYAGRFHRYNCGLSTKEESVDFMHYKHATIFSSRYVREDAASETVLQFISNAGPSSLKDIEENDIREMVYERLEAEQYRCRLIPLSTAIRENGISRIDLLKIDVEKSELDVLLGIDHEDWKKIKQIVVEVHDDAHGRLGFIEQMLKSKGFSITTEQSKDLTKTSLYDIYAIAADGVPQIPETSRQARKLVDDCFGIRQAQTDRLNFLTSRLPAYMVPKYWIELDELSFTTNGKVNRKALAGVELAAVAQYVPPSNDIEKKLVEMWTEILHLHGQRVSVEASFFEIGGHSLRAIILISAIHKAFSIRLPLKEIFRQPTIRGIAKLIRTTETLSDSHIFSGKTKVVEI